MTPALILALSLMAASTPPPDQGEPLPPGAPTGDYQLSAWCYGALSEYLAIYDRVKPDLVAINKMFGDPVKESEPYQADIAAFRKELKMIGNAVTLAEKASPRPIAPEGAAAVRQGRMIWSVVEAKPHRELARAWLTWGLPDRCDSVPRQLAERSLVLGKALSYNAGSPGGAASADEPGAPLGSSRPAQSATRGAQTHLAETNRAETRRAASEVTAPKAAAAAQATAAPPAPDEAASAAAPAQIPPAAASAPPAHPDQSQEPKL